MQKVAMRVNALAVMLWVLSASAQDNSLPQSGPLKPGFARSNAGKKVLEDSGRQPNATHSVTVNRTFDNSPETWTWHVNITEVSVPNQVSDLGQDSADFSEGLHVANTQWQLDWRGDQNSFQDLLAQRNQSVYFLALVSNKPSNITRKYQESDNGNCAPVLGDQCTNSIMDAASRSNSINLQNLNGCQNTLTVSEPGGVDDGSAFELSPAGSGSNSSDTTVLNRGATLFYRTSEAYNNTNANATWAHATSALHVFIMAFKNHNNGERRESSGAAVLCQIVDKNAAGGSDSGGSKGDSGSPDKPGSVLARWPLSVGAIWCIVIFSTAMVVM